MFHGIMTTNNCNNQSYSTYWNPEQNDPSVETGTWGIPQKMECNASEQFNNFDYVDRSSLSCSENIDDGFCDLTSYQATSILTRPFEDTTSSNVSGSDPVMANSWQISNSSMVNYHNVLPQTSHGKQQRNISKRSATSNTAECFPLESKPDSIPAVPLKSKPKRRRVQNTRQRKEANVREKKRMVQFNEAFDSLKSRLPTFDSEKQLSRMETLRFAIDYISFMKDVLANKNTSDNAKNSLDVSSDLDAIDFSFTMEDLECLDHTYSSDSGHSTS